MIVGSVSKASLRSSEAGLMRSGEGILLVLGLMMDGGLGGNRVGCCAPCLPVVIRVSAILLFALEDGDSFMHRGKRRYQAAVIEEEDLTCQAKIAFPL